MTKSHRSSSTSASCRLDWRPSRLLVSALLLITLLAVFCVLVSGMPKWVALPVALWTACFGFRSAHREWRLPTIQLVFQGEGMPASVDGQVVETMDVEWRGPLAFAKWRVCGGETRRLAWWPDTLPAASRRELRLAASGNEAARPRS